MEYKEESGMKTVKAGTKKAEKLIRRAETNEGYYLRDVYGRFSKKKQEAWQAYLAQFREEAGSDFRICSHSTSNFSVAWRVKDGWRMETVGNSYLILIEE